MKHAFTGADIIIIPAGIPRKNDRTTTEFVH
jgi:malate/lactate dehydrogenase